MLQQYYFVEKVIIITDNLEFLEKNIKDFWWNRVWVTKKIRINAESNRNVWNSQLQFLLNYYSTMIVAFSVLFFIEPKEEMELVMLLISIFSLGIGIITTGFELERKANEFKKSHILLDKLEAKTKHLENKAKNKSLSFEEINNQFYQIQIEYADIINETGNHINYDRLKYLQSQELNELKKEDIISLSDWIKYFKNNRKYYLLKLSNLFVFIVLIAAPLLIILRMIWSNFN